MNKIRILSESTINKIAAGEVIENPASVVKELVENAIDAGASEIKIETRAGGQQWIRISDNGSGMGRDDAILCFERHATSKIREASDLFEISSMGFRGEALASIAAISKMTLLTATEKEQGVAVEVDGGKILSVNPCARKKGTTIEVRSLFYNVPARKKFQKTIAVNTLEITKTITALALAHPEIHFQLVHQEKEIFSLLSSSLEERTAHLLGEEFTKSIFSLSSDAISGFIGSPFNTRHNRSGQFLFINKRPVVCPLISLAVRDGYATTLGTNRHPIFVLHLTVDQKLIDVNVHPQKREVRLREEDFFKEKIRKAVSERLHGKSAPIAVEIPSEPFVWDKGLMFKEVDREEKDLIPSFSFADEKTYKAIGLYSHFLLLEEQQSLMIVDLIGALSRLGYENLTANFSFSSQKQALMFPLTLNFSLPIAETLETYIVEIERLGIEMRKLSGSAFLVEAIPPYLPENEVQETLELLAEDLQMAKLPHLKAMASIASRFAKAHKKGFMLQEAVALYEQLLRTSSPKLCPQGKPITVCLNDDALIKLFKND